MLGLGSISMDRVINELCYIGTLFQRNYRKMTIKWAATFVAVGRVRVKWDL